MQLDQKQLSRPFLVFFVGVLVFIHIRLYQYAFDDAFIHFRIVRNFIETGYPYYNVGEMLKVSTSSGWIIFLSILWTGAKLFDIEYYFPLLISIVNAFILVGNLYIYTKILGVLLGREIKLSEEILLSVSLTAFLLPSSIGLMETPTALFLAGWGIYFLLLSKPSGFLFLGVAAYFRIELALLHLLAIIFSIGYKKFRVRQVFSYSFFAYIFFIFFDLYFFKTLIPQSIEAKSTVYSLHLADSLLSLFQAIPIVLIPNNRFLLGIVMIAIFSLFFLIGIKFFFERRLLQESWSALLIYLWGFGIFSLYIFKHAFIFDWYVPLFMIPILIVGIALSAQMQFPEKIIFKIPLLILFFLSLFSVLGTVSASVYKPSTFFLFEGGARVKRYMQIAEVLNQEMPNSTLLTSEIGGLGYVYRGEILDAIGLASSDALIFHPMKIPDERENGTVGAIPAEYVKKELPDIIISYDRFARALLNDKEIASMYTIVALPAYSLEDEIYSRNKTMWGDRYIRVYIRKSYPVPKGILSMQNSD